MPIDLSYLNKDQKQAVTHDQGPAILIAGAGTGKTTVITQRIAHLIAKKKATPDEILAVTFTEKAAGEMIERVDKLLPLGYSDLWIHTFHGFCEKVLKDYALEIGLSNDFKLLDQTAAWMLVRENLDKFDLNYYAPLGNPTRFIHALLSHFSRLKDEVVYPEEYLKYAEGLHLGTDQAGDREEAEMEVARAREVANAYHVYQQLLLENNALDFGDLINYTLDLFKKRPPVLKKFREQFKYILVDEFQDTNWAQYELIKILAAPKNNLMVVGDDDQAIYKFRGAAISNILNFKKEHKNLTEIFLNDNYRSGQKILDTAYNFIQQNDPDRLEYQYKKSKVKLNKKLTSHVTAKGSVDVLSFIDKNAEIDGILAKIVDLKQKNKDLQWSDFAILVRANDQAQGFVSMMRKLGIPHQFMASRGLYAQDIVQDIMAYLKLLDNYHESSALFRILSLPVTGLNISSIINLNHLARKKAWSLYAATKNNQSFIQLPLGEQRIIDKVISDIDKHTNLAKEQPVSQIIYNWLEDSGYLNMLTIEQNQYNTDQLHFLNQFFRKVRTWEEESIEDTSVHNFLETLDMEMQSGEMGAMQFDAEAGPDVVKVMTVHGAKGLEFKYVFITNLVHLRFPSTSRRDLIEIPEQFIKEDLPTGDAHLQEERRLFYVAMTRAKESVYLTWAKNYGGSTTKKPSRFIDEIKIATKEILTPIKEPNKINAKIAKPNYPVPKTFSFSQLRAYESCPWQYFYTFVAKVPTKGNAYFSFGKTMHSTLQKFYQLIINNSELGQGDLFSKDKKIKAPTQKDLLAFYEESWIDDWYESEDQKQKYYQDGIRILKDYFKKYIEDPERSRRAKNFPTPLFLEKGFTIKVKDYSLRGVFDRVDADKKGWEIIDYKTGKAKEKLTFDDKKQLLIYQIASEEVFKQPVKDLTFFYLTNNSPVSFVGTEKEITKTKDWIKNTIDDIVKHDFTATPGHVCGTCDFKSICPYAKLSK
ncbi:MAG: ATP-dependent helicase [Candidatus Komeilibacteria bacterium]|jgi:DNA helicase II / ATP-dependent DNA helicase PcrA|nr:ATP-dependent helicase [Candidatus Komeilibacteria bacterium]MBT4447261.1 ATP-dependent helicase [Candidatus Komeilibacteria bacterium]